MSCRVLRTCSTVCSAAVVTLHHHRKWIAGICTDHERLVNETNAVDMRRSIGPKHLGLHV